MLPTLSPGQGILSFNWAYVFSKPKIGDLVVVKHDGKEIIKRMTKIPDRGKMIMLAGDNPKQSTDSRHFGPISMDWVVGKVVYPTKDSSTLL